MALVRGDFMFGLLLFLMIGFEFVLPQGATLDINYYDTYLVIQTSFITFFLGLFLLLFALGYFIAHRFLVLKKVLTLLHFLSSFLGLLILTAFLFSQLGLQGIPNRYYNSTELPSFHELETTSLSIRNLLLGVATLFILGLLTFILNLITSNRKT